MSLRLRSLALLALVAASLSACVVVPYGRRGGYVAAPVVVAPYPYYGGYGGYGGYHRHGGRW